MTKEIWVLADEKAGHTNQSLGVAEALGWPMQIKKIAYTKHADLPNWMLGASLKGVDKNMSDNVSERFPDLVIATGRRLAPVAKFIKKASRGKTKIVQIMWPGFPSWGFDLIAAPAHDEVKPAKNRIITLTAPHRINQNILSREAETWRRTLEQSGATPPYISVLLGATATDTAYTKEFLAETAKSVSLIAEKMGATVLISNSRRSPKDMLPKFLENISINKYSHDTHTSRANPYLAFLGLAQGLIVTGDSVSMLSECIGSGRKTLIAIQESATKPKHKKFISYLTQSGCAKILRSSEETEAKEFLLTRNENKLPPLNPSKQVADEILKLYN